MCSVNSELPPPYTHSENFSHSSSLYANPFIEQIEHYPQEKLHVSTDKDSYIAGDTIWPYQESRRTQRNTSVRKVSDFDV